MPRLGETMEEGTLVAWLVAPGERFERGTPLLEVETDKTVVEVPALGAGVLRETRAAPGDAVRVGEPLAVIEPEGAGWATGREGDAEGGRGTAGSEADDGTPRPKAGERGVASGPGPEGAAMSAVRATPPARREAARLGVALAALSGTGRRGRIELRDVEAAAGFGVVRHEGPVAYVVDGPPDGPPVLLLHGFAGDRTVWAALAARLTAAGARVMAADLPGHGRTRSEAEGPDALAQGVAEAAGAVLGGPAHVVAHSLGAVAGVALAEAGARSLTLIAPAGMGLRVDAAFLRGMAAPAGPAQLAHLMDRLTDRPRPLSAEALAALHATLARGRLTALAAAAASGAGQTVNLRGTVAALAERIPVRLVVGHRDRIVPWRDGLTVSPAVAVHHLPRAGHMPFWDEPDAVASLLLRAIRP